MTVTMEDVKHIVSLQLGIKTIGDHDRFLEDLGAESADVLNIVVAVEEKFNIRIEEAEIQDILTPAKLLKLIAERT